MGAWIASLTSHPAAKMIVLDTLADVDIWAAEKPLDDSLVLCAETSSFMRYNEAGGGAVTIGSAIAAFAINADAAPGSDKYTNTALIGKTILSFAINGVLKRVVSSAPGSSNQVSFNSLTGQFTLYAGSTFGNDWLHVLYSNTPSAADPSPEPEA